MEKIKKTLKNQGKKISRRDFLGGATAAAAFTIIPRHVLGGPGYTPPSEKLNIAGIGLGGQGSRDIERVGSENIVALCDVDDENAAAVFNTYPKARKYHDFRKMLEKQKDIDAVVIATPDHNHAVISMMAIKMGKHVYCEKPLTHTVYEARKVAEAAREAKIATQMGNQGHSSEGIRLVCEWVRDGAIGPVREVQAWTPLPLRQGKERWWVQGIERPKDEPPVPSTLDWNLWLGPAAYRPYNPAYLPLKWRAWCDFGTGVLGDQACHTIDIPFWALNLGYPSSVEASSTEVNSETYPKASIVYYKFPARGKMPAVNLTWYDGGLMPPRPEELEPGRRMGNEYGGVIFIGDKGKLICGTYGQGPRLIPESKMREYKRPPKTLPRSKGHYKDWIGACKGSEIASANFDYGGPLTEIALLGNIAIRMGSKLNWDGTNMKITNIPEANEYLHRQYRKEWAL
ncbi:MAG: Gfo/Idh/MocA family oxidoreductase [Sedimentisphaerales bacterium]|nr:Gfo/Idh/MocA family oxidoreductase [Sedimentisphaerales bacterium]